jgi:6-pyruvoyltetrahydropterin/6-carboxytetrahydropterin synthase
MKISCIRILEFDAAHRVVNHESKCATLHGHRYKVEIHARANQLDEIGRVIDFSVLKEKIGSWIDEAWDHTSIIFVRDTQTLNALFNIPHKKKPFVAEWNPTAENMANYLAKEKCPELLKDTNVEVFKVVIWETPNCFAVAEVDNV